MIVQAFDVERTYRRGEVRVAAVRGVSLRVEAGDYVTILGLSGSGKSTLLNLLGGIDLPTGGRVELLGRDTQELKDRELTRLRLRRVGFVFQRFHLLPALTARENVELPMSELGERSRAERRRRTLELLDYVGLSHRVDHRPGQLSGGEMQRVAIARALANDPALILADEPTGELDLRTGAEIAELFRRLNSDGTTLIVVTHDPKLAEPPAEVFEMRDGRIAPRDGASAEPGGPP